MKKLIYSIGVLALVSFTMVSCDNDLEEINKNPNQPTEVRTNGLFNGANRYLMYQTRGGFPSGRMALPWVQYSAQRNYTDEDRYNYRVGTANSMYNDINRSIKNYKEIIDFVDNPANAAKVASFGDPANQKAAARIMIAYAYLQQVDMFGDVPYYSYGSDDPDFEGMLLLEPNEKPTPKLAPQEKIYKDLMNELKEAEASINLEATNVFNTGDHLFKSPKKLSKFANSLRLKIGNRVKSVIPEAIDHIKDAINRGVMESNDDTVVLFFQNDKVNPAPFHFAGFVDNRNDFSPANTFVNLLKGESESGVLKGKVDPRLFKMIAPVSQNVRGEEVQVQFGRLTDTPNIEEGNYIDREPKFYVGLPVGILDEVVPSQIPVVSQFSATIYKANYGEVLMEYAEVEFLLAENNNWNTDNYTKGITASMERWGVKNDDIVDYLKTVPAASEESVLTQKYISLYMQPYEAWAEYRRTKFPKTFVLPGETRKLATTGPKGETTYVFQAEHGLKDLPERVLYPTSIILNNSVNVEAASARMGGDKLDTKLIWAKK